MYAEELGVQAKGTDRETEWSAERCEVSDIGCHRLGRGSCTGKSVTDPEPSPEPSPNPLAILLVTPPLTASASSRISSREPALREPLDRLLLETQRRECGVPRMVVSPISQLHHDILLVTYRRFLIGSRHALRTADAHECDQPRAA